MFPPNENDINPMLPKKCIRCGFRSVEAYTECYQCTPISPLGFWKPPVYPKLYYVPYTVQHKLSFMYLESEDSDV